MSYSGTPTLYGEQQIAAAYTTGVRLPVVSIAVGDGNGVAVTPTEGMTALVHEVWRGNITSWGVDPADTRRIVIHTTVPATAGPFTVREAGVYDQNGGLICVTALAATEIVAPGTSNQATSIDLTVALPIGTAGAITVSPTLGERFTVERLYRTPFISINSASVTAPPVSPAIGDLYIVPTGATGAWATATIGTIAEWNDTFWSFLAPPTKMVAGIMDQADGVPSEFLKWTGTAWESFAAAGGIITVIDTAVASTADELVGNASPGITSYEVGQIFLWRKGAAPNATATPNGNVNGLGDKPFTKRDTTALSIGDLPANAYFLSHYDGTSQQVLGTLPSDIAALLAGNRQPVILEFRSGTGTWTSTVNGNIRVRVWGAGGAGGTGTTAGTLASDGPGGGGGGGYSTALKPVAVGDVLTVVVGNGGAGANGSGGTGGNGGSSSVSNSAAGRTWSVSATGGTGGDYGGSSSGHGGPGGTGAGGDEMLSGQTGGPGAYGLGGIGGSSPNGGLGCFGGTGGPGGPPNVPGGGSAGNGFAAYNGGSLYGAAGGVNIEF